MKKCFKGLLLCLLFCTSLQAQNIFTSPAADAFAIVNSAGATPIYVDVNDAAVVQKAAGLLQADIEKVTGKRPKLVHQLPSAGNVIIIGTVSNSPVVDRLLAGKKLTADTVLKRWEGYHIQKIKSPVKGLNEALVIAGSDRRGTAFGVFELSAQMGVSPWYYWADVPVKKSSELYFTGSLQDAPKVKYRGIFINDEAPALSGWSKKTFGGFNHLFYEKVFELILRMKGNYLWPAMWGSAFNDDDTLNPILADQYAIVMGTSHHEPLTRAHDEWRRYGTGKWKYDSNATNLRAFWRKGMERMGKRENIVSIGMRGDGDEPMTQGTAIALLEKIVKDQREIIAETTGKPAAATPQLWALYKEVQDYYDKGMRVPDDVTLLLCDDNWGNIRKLPNLNDKPHAGGYGIYYHFDYVGGPRNYKWINTNQIERTWEQMHLAYEHGVKNIWIVNVGDIKPMEFPTQFFLDYAWNPDKIKAEDLPAYYTHWATKQFGAEHAKSIGELVATYTKYNSRRKPELLDANTYSLHRYNEAQRVTNDYNVLEDKAEEINKLLTDGYKDAYFQLVLHPIKASANLHNLYTAVAYNRFFAAQNALQANKHADSAEQYYNQDSLLTLQYHTIAGGKWDHMMDQTHIGYTYWQQPLINKMPAVKKVAQDSAQEPPTLITPRSNTAVELIPKSIDTNTFYEKDGYVSIEAAHFSTHTNGQNAQWQTIPNLGRTLSAVTVMPAAGEAQELTKTSAHLSYNIYLYDTGKVKVHSLLSPTLPFHNKGLQYAISIDDETPLVVNMHEGFNDRIWNQWVASNIIDKVSEHRIATAGKHTLKFWFIDRGVVLQKLMLDAGGLLPSYLGPEETIANQSK